MLSSQPPRACRVLGLMKRSSEPAGGEEQMVQDRGQDTEQMKAAHPARRMLGAGSQPHS